MQQAGMGGMPGGMPGFMPNMPMMAPSNPAKQEEGEAKNDGGGIDETIASNFKSETGEIDMV